MSKVVLASVGALMLLSGSWKAETPKVQPVQAPVPYGFVCWTPYGTCATPPRPVGSPCTCGAAAGVVVQ
jgi:hypothetical protein